MRELSEQLGGKGCVLVYGNFNVIHPGHLRLLRFAKDCGNTLVVGVNSDEQAGKAALVSELDRLEGVLANTYVDHGFTSLSLSKNVKSIYGSSFCWFLQDLCKI